MDPAEAAEFVAIDGADLHFRECGEGAPVLMIHGLGSCGADWALQLSALSPHFRLLLPDLPGSGLSAPPPEGYAIDVFARRLWRLLDVLEVGDAALVGFSLGGAVALEMALQRPQAVQRLALINSLPSYRVDHWRKAFEVVAQVSMVRLLGLARTAQLVSRRMFPHPSQAPMRERLVQVFARNDRARYLATVRALVGWCALDRLDRLAAPALMLAAEHDYTSLLEKRRFAERMDARFHCVRGARHGLPFDSIEATNRVLLAWLRDEPFPEASEADDPTRSPALDWLRAYQSNCTPSRSVRGAPGR